MCIPQRRDTKHPSTVVTYTLQYSVEVHRPRFHLALLLEEAGHAAAERRWVRAFLFLGCRELEQPVGLQGIRKPHGTAQ